jgi:hypothetical protein
MRLCLTDAAQDSLEKIISWQSKDDKTQGMGIEDQHNGGWLRFGVTVRFLLKK